MLSYYGLSWFPGIGDQESQYGRPKPTMVVRSHNVLAHARHGRRGTGYLHIYIYIFKYTDTSSYILYVYLAMYIYIYIISIYTCVYIYDYGIVPKGFASQNVIVLALG